MTDLTTPAGDAVREKYRREGAAQERERIIKLLETKPDELMCCTCGIDELIALIKGESVQEPAVSTNDGQGNFTDKQRKAIKEMMRVSQEIGEVD